MSEWQDLMQIRSRLRAALWPGGGSSVFGDNVVVSAALSEGAVHALTAPFVVIQPGGGQHDPDNDGQEPGLIRVEPSLLLVVSIPGDAVGENAILGANRLSELASDGRGLLEVQEIIFQQVRLMNSDDGIRLEFRGSSEANAVQDPDLGYVAFREYIFELWTGFERFYPTVAWFTATDQGSGIARLLWRNPSSRFDLFRIRIRRAAGSIAPATINDGVEITLPTDLPVSHNDTPGAGTFSYSIFVTYDERTEPPDTDDHISSKLAATVLVT